MIIALLAAASSVHTVRWANAFAERGHVVHLITVHAPDQGLSRSVSLHQLPFMGGMGYLLNGSRLKALIHHLKPDVVNVHYATGYGTLARWCKDFPVVLNVWGSDVFEFPDKSIFHRTWLLLNLRTADQLISTSKFMAQHTASLSAKLPPLTVVPFGVDIVGFSPAAHKNDDDPLVIGTVKSLAPVYGIDILIRAFALLVGTGRYKLRLRIVGGGPQLEQLQELARSLGVSEQVDFIGAVPHSRVPEELRALDIYVALSRSESFGVAVIEASSCGLPVVVSNVGGLPEVVEDGITGFVVPSEDAEAAAAKMEELLDSAELRQRMGKAGRANVQDRYRWSHCVDRQLAVFQQVIDERKRA